jgi:hypothetical protein
MLTGTVSISAATALSPSILLTNNYSAGTLQALAGFDSSIVGFTTPVVSKNGWMKAVTACLAYTDWDDLDDECYYYTFFTKFGAYVRTDKGIPTSINACDR